MCGGKDKATSTLVLEPRGDETHVTPTSLEELFDALRAVLTALTHLHKSPWMHRDIRWGHVLKRHAAGEASTPSLWYFSTSTSWFLAGFDDAAESPQPWTSASHLCDADHAPEIRDHQPNHTQAVDLWSVGRLIDTCPASMRERWLNDNAAPDRRAFRDRLMRANPGERPTAVEALGWLERLALEHQSALGERATSDPELLVANISGRRTMSARTGYVRYA